MRVLALAPLVALLLAAHLPFHPHRTAPHAVLALNPFFAGLGVAAVGVALGLSISAHRMRKYRDGLEGQVVQLEDRVAAIRQMCTTLRSCPDIPPRPDAHHLVRRQLLAAAAAPVIIGASVKRHRRKKEIRSLQERKADAEYQLWYLEKWLADFRRMLPPAAITAFAQGRNPFATGELPEPVMAGRMVGGPTVVSHTRTVEIIDEDVPPGGVMGHTEIRGPGVRYGTSRPRRVPVEEADDDVDE
jgi:hypothetical protein